MRVLLLGGTGLAGAAFNAELSARGCDIITLARSNADINCDLTDFQNLTSLTLMY